MAELVSRQLDLSQSAIKVLEKRYLKKDEEGNIVETSEDLFRRVAKTVANVELNYAKSEEEVRRIENEF